MKILTSRRSTNQPSWRGIDKRKLLRNLPTTNRTTIWRMRVPTRGRRDLKREAARRMWMERAAKEARSRTRKWIMTRIRSRRKVWRWLRSQLREKTSHRIKMKSKSLTSRRIKRSTEKRPPRRSRVRSP